jgi:hypothetical protein
MEEPTMTFPSWLQNLRSTLTPGRGLRQHRRRKPAGCKLFVKPLEGRTPPRDPAAIPVESAN